MGYEKIAQLIEANAEELAAKTIEQCLRQKYLLAGKFDYEAQNSLFEDNYGIIARYIRHGNPTEWSEFIQKISHQDSGTLSGPDFITGVGEIIMGLLKELVAQEVPGSENETERKKLYNRLDNMHSIAKLTMTVTHLKEVSKNN